MLLELGKKRQNRYQRPNGGWSGTQILLLVSYFAGKIVNTAKAIKINTTIQTSRAPLVFL